MTSDWVTWGLQLVIGLLLMWSRDATLKNADATLKNTEAITALRIDLPTNYESKHDHEADMATSVADRLALNKSLHDLKDTVQVLQLKMAAAHLNGKP